MGHQSVLEREVRDIIKKNHWLTLSTNHPKGAPQSSVVVYASDGNIIYILTGKNTQKIRNISSNQRVAVTIPFYKNLLHKLIGVAPPASISFRATAEILNIGDCEAYGMYTRVLNIDLPEDYEADSVWLRLTPKRVVTCYGVGVSLPELRDPSKAYKVIRLAEE
jgi:uncharacterized protein YhbP (UPF0306 family)